MSKHKAHYLREGWEWECKCGAGGSARTKAEAIAQYREHRARKAEDNGPY